MLHQLRTAGFDPAWRRVETESEFLAGLEEAPDIVLADYYLPQYDALQALALVQQRGMDIPFIVVTGTVREGPAVECMKRGATDYLLKDRLGRLGSAVAQALEQRRVRRERGLAEQALRESEERFRRLAENAPDIIYRRTMGPVRGAGPDLEELSPLEAQVLKLIVEGCTNGEIARDLHYSVGAIKNAVQRIIEKLGVSDRTQAAVYAVKAGFTPGS